LIPFVITHERTARERAMPQRQMTMKSDF
jgi:hypothetical protein